VAGWRLGPVIGPGYGEAVTTPRTDRAWAEARDAADPLAHFRDRFVHGSEPLIYLDGNSLGPLPAATQARIAEVVSQEWGTGLVRSWNDWIELPERAGDLIGAHLAGAAPGQLTVTDSTTVNLYKLACAALDAQPGRDVIVTDDDNFPTDRYVLAGVAAQRGCELRIISTDINEGISLDTLRDAIDERTALVSLSHVAYRSGALANMAAITELVHGSGALVLWDLCHAIGAVPIELDAAGADLAIGCTYKYVNAGPGAPAFLYVRAELQERLRQPVWGWFGHADQFGMGPGYEPAPGITRFMTGTPQIIGTAAVEEGARLLGEAGMGPLRAKSTELTGLLIALADEWLTPLGFSLATPREASRRGAHVSLRHPHAQLLSQALIREGVVPDYRTPERLRLGPVPIISRFTDVWDALDTLRRLVTDGSYAEVGLQQVRVT
jgi:kynureninase